MTEDRVKKMRCVVVYWREILSFIPISVLIYAGYSHAPPVAYLDILAALAVVVLLADPFVLISSCLAPASRAYGVVIIILTVVALQLPAISVYFRICFLGIAALLVFIVFKKHKAWFDAYRIRQSPEVDKVLAHMAQKGVEMDAQTAWDKYGARETRALLHQALNLELPEINLQCSHRAVYLLGYLHGIRDYTAELKKVKKKLATQEQINDNLKNRIYQMEDKSKEHAEIIDEVVELRRKVSNLESYNSRLSRNLREAREEVERLQPPPPEKSRNELIVEYVAQGHSQNETAEHFNVSPATVSRAVKAAKNSIADGEKVVS